MPCTSRATRCRGGKILGGSYFSGRRRFAFEPTAAAIRGDTVRSGPLIQSDLVVAGFYVLSAPDLDVAVRITMLHSLLTPG